MKTCECPHCRGFRTLNPHNVNPAFNQSLRALEKANTPKKAKFNDS
jgi:hypothetical protein